MAHEISIRAFNPEDAEQMSALFKLSVLELGRYFYSQEQVTAWAARGPSPEKIRARNQGELWTWVAENAEGEILAFGELERDGHIDQVYARPDAAGKGIVSNLYEALETQAREVGINRLYTEASEGARRFFLKKNFVETGRREFQIEGVSIHNYAMEKRL